MSSLDVIALLQAASKKDRASICKQHKVTIPKPKPKKVKLKNSGNQANLEWDFVKEAKKLKNKLEFKKFVKG